MKANHKKLIVMLLLVCTLTGCTTYLKTDKNKNVQNPYTGQNLTSNILCQPEEGGTKSSKETLKLYEKYKKDLKELPKCSEFNVTSGGYEGIWTTIFVKPLAWVIIKLGELFGNYGIAIIATTLLIRLITISFTKKTAMQSENLKLARPELDRLEKKYRNKQDQESLMRKNQEMLGIYKKYNINPMSGCLFSLIQIPLFFAFYEAMNRLPVIFEEVLFGFHLGTNPLSALGHGQYIYIITVVLVIAASYFSMRLNSGAAMSGEQANQMKMMSNMMVIFIGIASLSLSTGIALYWIVNNTFTIIQNLVVKRRKQKC